MARKKTPAAPSETGIDAIRHKDARVNIPTEELRDFVDDQETNPGTLLYPRDPSLDPQLVWKGKDEQDRQDLSIPVVPVYIQEKIHPLAIVEAIRSQARVEARAETQMELFGDFNGIDDFDKKVDFYHHEQHWSNRMILGDSLLVMASLAEKEGLRGKVQTIYLDPPYGIKFGSNWQVSTRKRDVRDGKTGDATRQPEQIRAFRDTWNLGIHSYLAYLRDRLIAARDLLSESGSVFVQIGDDNLHLVRSLLDEVFGSNNQAGTIIFTKTSGSTGRLLSRTVDFILWYSRDIEFVKFRSAFIEKIKSDINTDFYGHIEQDDGSRRPLSSTERRALESLSANARLYHLSDLTSQRVRESRSGYFPIEFKGKTYLPSSGEWKTNREGIERLRVSNRLQIKGNQINYVRFLDDFPAMPIGNLWDDTGTGGFVGDDKTYVVQTDSKVVARCLLMTTDPGDLVLDPTCGSGTTAYVAEQWGRRWIMIDTSRVALALARTRIMAGKYPYYLLADSPEGARKEAELSGQAPAPGPFASDVRKGFVYRRVPHVTLKSIANNPDIREGMTRAEIDAAIARHAESETLFDKPYDDPKRLRVAGPFTVESLSPHRIVAAEDDRPASEAAGRREPGPGEFVPMVLEHLRKAGVQNTVKAERLVFNSLDPHAGTWVHATGTYTDADGKPRRVAVSIGPEHGTVGPEQVKQAAKEAVQGLGYDLLIVCGFAFDPHVPEEAKRYGKLTVQPVRMNPDLGMGELLKATGAGNLFMIFGEPDVEVTRTADGKLIVEVKGIDVYDPTTGQVRSGRAVDPSTGKVQSDSLDDIACWFLDTDYNGESFFVRHAYFTGADDPYGKLKRALRAEIDEAAWSALASTRSYPFPPPTSGKVAVKVINHYGDEALKVLAV